MSKTTQNKKTSGSENIMKDIINRNKKKDNSQEELNEETKKEKNLSFQESKNINIQEDINAEDLKWVKRSYGVQKRTVKMLRELQLYCPDRYDIDTELSEIVNDAIIKWHEILLINKHDNKNKEE